MWSGKLTTRVVLLVIVAVVVQEAVISQISIFGVNADVTPLVVMSIGLLTGSLPGAIVGFFCGLLVDTLLVQTLGITSLLYIVIGYWSGRLRELRDPAHGLVPLGRVVVQRHAQGDPRAVVAPERQQRGLEALHGTHRVGQHQHPVARIQRIAHHGRQLAVHERLAAGEGHLLQLRVQRPGFPQEGERLGPGEVAEPVVGGAALDVAAGARDVA